MSRDGGSRVGDAARCAALGSGAGWRSRMGLGVCEEGFADDGLAYR